MPALLAVGGQVLVVEVGDALLHLEAEALVEHDGGVVAGHVQDDVLARAGLKRVKRVSKQMSSSL